MVTGPTLVLGYVAVNQKTLKADLRLFDDWEQVTQADSYQIFQ